jgi:hypothetical protein
MMGGNNIMKLRKCSLFAAIVGALLLTAAFAPKANAILVVYYNFEDQPPVPDLTSEAIGLQTPVLVTTYNTADISEGGGLANNVFPTDPDGNTHSLGLHTAMDNNGATFCFTVNTKPLVGMSLSFGINTMGNGFDTVDGSFIIGGVTTDLGTMPITSSTGQTITFAIPAAAEGNSAVTFCLTFLGGKSNGVNPQNNFDNLRLDARQVIPEPASVVGGLLGALAICWNQRRRLISLLRLRQA